MATSLRPPPAGETSLPYPRLSVVLNEKAGAILAAGKTPDLTDRLQSGGAVVRTVPPGELPDRLRSAMQDADAVIVAGGDGTIACAAAALSGSSIPLGILPGGTMNLLAKDLHLPIADMSAAASVVLAGHTREIDVGAVGEHVFLCACMMGTPARIGHHREQARLAGPWRQWLGFLRAVLRVLARPKALRLDVSVDDAMHRLKTASLTITVNAVEDVAGRLFARSRLDGGTLFAYVARRKGALPMARVFARLALGWPRDPALTVLEGKSIVVDSAAPALRVLVDGEERLLRTPVTFRLHPRALKVFVPAELVGK